MLKTKLNIVIADAQDVFVEGLKTIFALDENLVISGEFSHNKGLNHYISKHHPDIVIIDYDQYPNFSAEDIVNIRQKAPGTNILVITSDTNKDSIFEVMDSGVINFITKRCGRSEVINALYAAAKGEKYFCNKIIDLILERHIRSKNEKDHAYMLTEREKEIVPHISKGLSNKQIALSMNVSYHTITTHRRNIFKKLQLKSASELAIFAIKAGML